MDFLKDILPLKNQLYRLALRITLNPQDAEDIVQETLIRLWRRTGPIEHVPKESVDSETGSLTGLAMTICRNLSLDSIRRKKTSNMSLDELQNADSTAHSEDPYAQLSRSDNIRMIREAMDALPEKQRTCMQLRDFEGLPYKEIASILSITEEQVKVNIFRARKAIRERILKTE